MQPFHHHQVPNFLSIVVLLLASYRSEVNADFPESQHAFPPHTRPLACSHAFLPLDPLQVRAGECEGSGGRGSSAQQGGGCGRRGGKGAHGSVGTRLGTVRGDAGRRSQRRGGRTGPSMVRKGGGEGGQKQRGQWGTHLLIPPRSP